MNRTKEYGIWASMKQRINNPKSQAYKHYGGRGITLCKRWEIFDNFIEDMGNKPTEHHTLDRIDNEKGYCPENCRWATRKEQSCNQRRNRMLEYKGQTKNLTEWASIKGLHVDTLHRRLSRGFTIEEALEIPLRSGFNIFEAVYDLSI